MLYRSILLYILAVVLRGHLHPAYQQQPPPPEPYFYNWLFASIPVRINSRRSSTDRRPQQA